MRWVVIGAWLAAIAAAAVLWAPRATDVLLGTNLALPGLESYRADQLLKHDLDASGLNKAVVVLQSSNLTVDSADFKAQAVAAADDLRKVHGVVTVSGYYTTGSPAYVSADRHTTLITASLEGDEKAQEEVIPTIRRALSGIGLSHWVTGYVATAYDSLGASEEDAHTAELIFLPVLLVLLLIVFRTLPSALIPLILGALTVTLAQGLLYPLGLVFPTSVVALNVGSMIGLGLCIDYALIVVNRYREEVLDGHVAQDALQITMATAGRSITYSGLTVVLAMVAMTLVLLPIIPIRSISLAVALVAAIALAFAMTLLPAVLSLLGRRIESLPVLPRRKRPAPGSVGFWYRLSDQIMARPVAWLVVGILVLAVLAAPLREIRFGASGLPSSLESSRGLAVANVAFSKGELTPIQIVIHSPVANGIWTPSTLGAVDDLTTRLTADPRVSGVASLRTAFASLPRSSFTQLTASQVASSLGALASIVDPAGDTTAINIYSREDEFARSTEALLADIRGTVLPAQSGLQGLEVVTGGETAFFHDLEDALYGRFPLLAAVVALLIFLVLLLFFQSVLLPLKAVILNLLSIGATLGVVVAVFQYGWASSLLGFDSLDRVTVVTPAILYVILFALSTDYEVFMLSRIREYYRQTRRNREAVAAGLQHTAGVITAAALILLGTFGSFAFGKTVVIKELGIGLAIGILIDSTVVRIILVPATMRLLGDTNWWMPSWLRRVLPDLREEVGEAMAQGVIEAVEPAGPAAPGPSGPPIAVRTVPGMSASIAVPDLPSLPAMDRAPAPARGMAAPARQPSQPARLLVQGVWDGPAQIVLRTDRPLRIGRDIANELRLIDLHVSRLHARIDYIDGQYMLSDLSFNGVIINGRRVAPAPALNPLHNGDRIHIRGFRPISFLFATETMVPAGSPATGVAGPSG